jgi:hypothetical protein
MFYRLILGHLVGDFVLQTRWLVVRKRTRGGLALHVGLVGLASLVVTWDRLGEWWPWLGVTLAVHAVIDWAKIRLEPRLRVPPIVPFVVDQVAHMLTIAAAVALAEADRAGAAWWSGGEPVWWVASVYLTATFALSIALPLWLDPPSLMQRPLAPRLLTIGVSALVLTLAWRGLPMLIPLVGLGLYQVVARRLARSPAMGTYGVEYLSALVVATCLGWWLQ